LILAGSFGLLALVPIDALRQFAFVMALGVGLDSFVVRPFLVPALITLFGQSGFWPGTPAPEPDADTGTAPPIPPRDPSAPGSAPAGPR
jgi:RND superfamily putative drug exporter